MMNPHQLIEDVQLKYGEWLEMAGENAPALLNNILATIIIKEKEKNVYYERIIESYAKKVEVR